MHQLYRWNARDSVYLLLSVGILAIAYALPRSLVNLEAYNGSYVAEVIGRMFIGLFPLWAAAYIFLDSHLFDQYLYQRQYLAEARRAGMDGRAILVFCLFYLLEIGWFLFAAAGDGAVVVDLAAMVIFTAALYLRPLESLIVAVAGYIIRIGAIIFLMTVIDGDHFVYTQQFWIYYESGALVVILAFVLGLVTRWIVQRYYNHKPSIWIGFPSALIIGAVHASTMWLAWEFEAFIDAVANYSIPLLLSIALGTAVLTVMYRSAAARRTEEALAIATERYVTNQIKPHFLYNTLGMIQAEIESDPQLAGQLLEHLSGMYRRITVQRHLIPLQEELAHVQDYLFIVKTAIEERLTSSLQIAADVDTTVQIPILSIQPIVENAVKYAVEPRTEGGTIAIRVESAPNGLLIIITDDGPGIDLKQRSHASTGIGLHNISQRWQREFGYSYIPQIHSILGEGTTVTFRIPIL